MGYAILLQGGKIVPQPVGLLSYVAQAVRLSHAPLREVDFVYFCFFSLANALSSLSKDAVAA